MRNLLLAGAAALSLAALPGVAQADHHAMGETAMMEMSSDQQMMYDGWPMDRQATYDGWPADVQTYYWTLPMDRQEAYWLLTDEQRVQVYNLTPEQRSAAWTSILAQVNGANTMATTTTTTPAATATTTAGTRFVSNEMAQSAPAPMTGEYPVCQGEEQDGCIQPREAGLNYGNRPLDYWPGQPASSM